MSDIRTQMAKSICIRIEREREYFAVIRFSISHLRNTTLYNVQHPYSLLYKISSLSLSLFFIFFYFFLSIPLSISLSLSCINPFFFSFFSFYFILFLCPFVRCLQMWHTENERREIKKK